MAENENGNGSSNALRALEEIRELRKTQADATEKQTTALNGINTKLGHIEGMIAVAAEGNAANGREVADLRRRLDEQQKEITTLKVEAAAGKPLQRLAWAVITVMVVGFGGVVWTNSNQPPPPPAPPPNITIQMPASAVP